MFPRDRSSKKMVHYYWARPVCFSFVLLFLECGRDCRAHKRVPRKYLFFVYLFIFTEHFWRNVLPAQQYAATDLPCVLYSHFDIQTLRCLKYSEKGTDSIQGHISLKGSLNTIHVSMKVEIQRGVCNMFRASFLHEWKWWHSWSYSCISCCRPCWVEHCAGGSLKLQKQLCSGSRRNCGGKRVELEKNLVLMGTTTF